MINIRIESVSDKKTLCKSVFDIKGKKDAVGEFRAVLGALEKADKVVFAIALMSFLDRRIEEESNDEK